MAQKEVVRGHEEEEHNAEEQKCKLIGNVREVLGLEDRHCLILRNLHTKEAGPLLTS